MQGRDGACAHWAGKLDLHTCEQEVEMESNENLSV